jgi:RNA polymerase sigma-70 factor (ECF subfamily)
MTPMSERDAAAIRRALDQGRARWPEVRLATEDFEAAIRRHVPAHEELDTRLPLIRCDDLYLATSCALGDPAALRFFEAYCLSGLGRGLHLIDRSPSFVDEVIQDVRAHLLTAPEGASPRIVQYSGRGALPRWVQAAASRLAITAKRRSRPTSETLSSQNGPVETGEPETAFVRDCYREGLQEALRDSLAELSSRQRNILRMHFIDGVPLEKIAQLYGTHRTTLSRWVTKTCNQVAATTRQRLATSLQLPPGAMDSVVQLLRSQLEFSASLLMSLNDEDGTH